MFHKSANNCYHCSKKQTLDDAYAVPANFLEIDVNIFLISNRSFTPHIVSVLHQNEGGIGKSIPDAQEISRDPRAISRVKGNLEGGGNGFPNTS